MKQRSIRSKENLCIDIKKNMNKNQWYSMLPKHIYRAYFGVLLIKAHCEEQYMPLIRINSLNIDAQFARIP